ncbi:MAG: ribosome silencing factor [Bacteroidales bacterium]|nr:ribosome silencing factor [Bacteroidales bacterium]
MKKNNTKKAAPDTQEPLDEVRVIAEAMLDKKAKDVISLDLRNIGTSISDYFVICNADSTTQVVAISDNVEEMMEKRCGRSAFRKQGRENAFWIILDYSDIVVHIFKTDQRLFYRLEDLWADAVKTTYEDQD